MAPGCSAPEEVGIAWGVGKKPPVLYILWLPIHCRQSVLYSEIRNLYSVRIEDGAHQHEDCIGVPLGCGSESGLNILGF
jgi:hypothetical protein